MTAIAAAGAAELDAALTRFVAQNGPGAAAGVVHGDELVWTAGAGFAEVGARVTSDPGTLYRIASITKTFTGTAVMQLRDAGRLDLDDPAVKYLPELRGAVSPFAPIEAVTIRRMLSHESGLANEPPGTDWSVPVYQGDPRLTLARPGAIAAMLAPNAQHKYSDLAYQLLGEIVTRVSGSPYPRYVRELILDPLGMSATGFEPLDGSLRSRRATGYSRRRFSDELDPEPAFPPVWAEGGLWSCVQDLARWVGFQLRAHTGPRTRRSWRRPRCGRCTSPATWLTMTGRAHGAFPGPRIARTVSAGSGTRAGFPVSLPASASIPGSRSAPSSCITDPALPRSLPASWR